MTNRRKEGLSALAGMIAKAYRRRMTGETVQTLDSPVSGEEALDIEAKRMACAEPAEAELNSGYVYKETVKIENFIRKKANRVSK